MPLTYLITKSKLNNFTLILFYQNQHNLFKKNLAQLFKTSTIRALNKNHSVNKFQFNSNLEFVKLA